MAGDTIPRFGASDFFLVQTDAGQLREDLRAALAQLLGRAVEDSDPHIVLASAFLPFLVQGQASADAAVKATLRAFAVGADLDRIADSTCVVGYLDRFPARAPLLAYVAHPTITRLDSSRAENITIHWEASRAVTVDDEEITFAGSGDYTLAVAYAAASVSPRFPMYLRADVPGKTYNGLLPMPQTYAILDQDAQVTITAADSEGRACTVVNGDAGYRCGSSYGGADAEDDASFAERVAWQAKALRVPGSLEYFRLALSELQILASHYIAPTVDSDGRIVMAWCDKADVYTRLNGNTLAVRGAGYDEFSGIVKASLLGEQRVMAYPARVDSTAFAVTYRLPASTMDEASARAQIGTAWRDYVARRSWHCGAIISSAEIDAVLRGAGASDVEIATGSAWSGYTVLPADTVIMDSGFSLVFGGLSVDSVAPAGSDGEEIAP